MSFDEKDAFSAQPSPKGRRDAHQARSEREAWALSIVKGMRKSPSAPDPEPGPIRPVHLDGDAALPGVVYFAYCAGRIKIGYSTDAEARMGGFTTHAPLPVTLLLTIPGAPIDEAAYHEMFAADRRHYEWFHLSFELRDFLTEKMGDDGFATLLEVETDFYRSIQDGLIYISELMKETACQFTSSAPTANHTAPSGTGGRRKPLERIIGPTGGLTIATKTPVPGS